ncbi:MAG: hypothetical protein IKA72_00645 [Clostridia bacterium]|nr:hypothetical protein [Clostridia bacterium]
MLFKNALKLFMENFKNVYKLLLYMTIVAIISFSLYSALLLPHVVQIWESGEMQTLISNVKELVFAVFQGESATINAMQEEINLSLHALLNFIASKTWKIILSVIGCGFVYLLTRFVDSLGYFSFGQILGDKMETYGDTPLHSAYVKNLGRGSAYAVVYVLGVFVYDIIVVAACYFLFFYLLSFLNIFISFFLSVTAIVVANALKLTLTSTWMPSMTADGYTLKQALSSWKNVQKKLRGGVFSTYLVSIYMIIVVNVIFGLSTFGSALILTLPASFFFLICLQYVNYYTLTGKKYFINYEQIVTNELHGDESLAVEHIAHLAEGQFTEEVEKAERAENIEK